MPKKSHDVRVASQESGITAAGDVTQNAGRDVAGRDIVNNFWSLLNVSSDAAEHWSGIVGERRATEQRRRFAANIRTEYKERLEQVQGQVNSYLRPKIRTAPQAIPDPLNFLQSPQQTLSKEISSHTSILEIYQQRQSLLVLGEPGSGKTTLLLELAVQILSNNDDLPEQVPVMIPLSTWGRRAGSLKKGPPSRQFRYWLAALLEELYKVPESLGSNWLKDGNLILLLDGLDEIALNSERSSFLAAMNEYVSKYSRNVVLSCRLAEYQAIESQAKLGRAVVIQAFEASDVLEFIGRKETTYSSLAESLAHDEEMLNLCTSPLFLSMLISAYPLQPAAGLDSRGSELNARTWLLRAYVDERFNQALLRENPISLPFVGSNMGRSLRWLSWLARNLTKQSQTDFLMERLQPNWLPKVGEFLVSFCLVLVIVPFGLLIIQPNVPIILNVAFIVFYPVFCVVTYNRANLNIHWSLRSVLPRWRSALAWSVLGAVAGLVIVVLKVRSEITSFTIWPLGFELNKYLTGAIIGALFGWVVGTILVGFTAVVAESRRGPYDSVVGSLWTGCWIFLMLGIATFFGMFLIYKIVGSEGMLFGSYVFFNLGSPGWDQALHISILTGFATAFIYGWGFVLAHMILRIWIWIFGVGPRPYVRWLNAMVDLRLMYRSGADFVFMHRILQEFFQSQKTSR
jgi:hypothetical protein